MANIKNDEIIAGGHYEPAFVVSSGSVLLDKELTNYNGIPSGSMIHYMSKDEGSFKTSLSLMGLVEIQKLGHPVGFVDAEHALSIDWAQGIGINTSSDMWFYSRPSSGEIALKHVEDMIIKYGCKGVVLDSTDAAQPTKLFEAEYGEANIGQHAKLITQGARKINNVVSEHDAIVFWINQMKVNLTQMGARGHKQTGGKALPFYCKLNMELDRISSNSQLKGENVIPLKLNIRRSKLGPSFREIQTVAIQGKAIDRGGELFMLAEASGLLKKAGSWYKTHDGTSIGQGMKAGISWAENNEEQILAFVNDGVIPETTD